MGDGQTTADEPLVIDIDRRPAAGRSRSRSRVHWWFVLVGVPLLAIGGLVLTRSDDDDGLLVVDEAGVVSLVDPATGDTSFEVPQATPTPDRSALLTTRTTGSETVLESRSPSTGDVTGSTTLDRGGLTVRTVSPQGGAVALLPGRAGPGLYEPQPRERTNLTVSYLDDRPARTYELDGNIEPEMFSYDESGLYVLDFVPPREPDSYHVRRLDLATGEVVDTGAPEAALTPRMRGKARASVLHPEGDQLFTLYTLPPSAEPVAADDDPDGPPSFAFVHVIDLKGDASFCVFLPPPIGTVDEVAVGMGISPDGDEVVVADAASQQVAAIDTATLQVTGVRTVDALRSSGGRAAVAVADDGTTYLGSHRTVLELGVADHEPARAWNQGTRVTGLSLTPDGEELRVGGSGVVTILDRTTGVERAVLEVPGRGNVTLLGPPRGSVMEFPVECAC